MIPRGGPAYFDPGSLGDQVAKLTDWGPCHAGGASFCTHVLRDDGTGRLSFRPTLGAIAFYLVFLVLGCVALVGAVIAALAPPAPVGAVIAFGLAGLVFGGFGAYMLWSGTQPIVFDRPQGLFWKGWSVPEPGAGARVELSTIHALQIISEYCGGKTRFYSYELNLVLKDGQRVNVVDHGDMSRLRSEGPTLARFLGVPLWDPAP